MPYSSGMAGIVLTVLWIVFIRDTPQLSKRISETEKNYIRKHLPGQNESHETGEGGLKNKKIPLKGIITSLPVYAMIVAVFASDWSFLFMATFVPSYLDDVFQLSIQNGLI
ncbi:hypothetical protein KUTeg_000513 [Tegillarca granosa]|uniref:Uncharacterized protein n=1 Tax=Tegillarca granosa TaxID=220873 RepID=A0ABQ9FXQ3_TEGGR|nr:hypothetical protein KUTeg_000513 [Tegillarca granosa]